MTIPIYYDPMLAKLITYGANRNEAIQNMLYAIQNFELEGVKTTLPFGEFVLKHEEFLNGKFDTHFVKDYYSPDQLKKAEEKLAKVAAHFVHELEKQESWGGYDRSVKSNIWRTRLNS